MTRALDERSARLFAEQLQGLGIGQVLDVGGACGQFGRSLRGAGFDGAIYSREPHPDAYQALLASANGDPRWFPLVSEHEQSTQWPLQADAQCTIGALRLDARDVAAIDGSVPWIERVRLLLVNGSAGENSSLSRLGFQLLPTETRADDGMDVAPCWAMYRRPASPLHDGGRAHGVQIGAVVTSVGGTLERRLPDGSDLGPMWLQSCVQSWRRLGPLILSVSERAPPEDIQWARTDARPSIAQMLAAARSFTSSHLLLTNADIVFTDALHALLGQLIPQAVYYGSRLDVERDDTAPGLVPRGIYELGFDYFLLPVAFVDTLLAEQLLPDDLRVGEPWWDYLLPLLALVRGFPVKKLSCRQPLALHYLHPTRYSEQLWARNRELFLHHVCRLQRAPRCQASGVLTELLANPGRIPLLICRGLP